MRITIDQIKGMKSKNEKIAIAGERLISIPNCYKEGKIRIKITRTKHNIFFGELV